MTTLSRSIALDVGDKRIGIAMSDPLGLTAQPHSVIERTAKRIPAELIELIRSEAVSTIVVGMPYELDGAVGDQAEKVKKFIALLTSTISKNIPDSNVQTIEWDERFTTHQAAFVVQGSGLKNSQRKQALDRISAAIILESYLNAQSSSGIV